MHELNQMMIGKNIHVFVATLFFRLYLLKLNFNEPKLQKKIHFRVERRIRIIRWNDCRNCDCSRCQYFFDVGF